MLMNFKMVMNTKNVWEFGKKCSRIQKKIMNKENDLKFKSIQILLKILNLENNNEND